MLPTAMLGAFAADNRKEAEPVKLRVGSYNIHNGSDMKHDFSILAEEILRARLDVIGLQEVDRGTNRSKKQDTVEVLVKALKEMTGSDSWYGYFTLATGMDGGQYGTAIISKYELKNTETVKLPHTSGYEQRSTVTRRSRWAAERYIYIIPIWNGPTQTTGQSRSWSWARRFQSATARS